MYNSSSTRFSSRSYQDSDDLKSMLALVMAARQQTNPWQYAHIGELLFNFWQIAIHLEAGKFIRLWFSDKSLAGFSMLGEDPLYDFQVLPEYEWQGIEEESIAWAEASVTDLRSDDPKQWGGVLVSGARQDNLQRRTFLEAHGFVQGGEFSEVNHLRSLDEPIPMPVLPEGFRLVSMLEFEDIHARAEAHRHVWHPWSVGKLSDEDYSLLMSLPYYQRELDLAVIAPDGTVAAYVNGWNDPVNLIGDFGPVGACTPFRRMGLTRAVLLECMQRMKTLGMRQVAVSTNLTNFPARGLYESIGFVPDNTYLQYIDN